MMLKISIYIFLLAHLLVPLVTPDLFPFSSFPMFSAKAPACISRIQAKDTLANNQDFKISDQSWIYIANDEPILGCGLEVMNTFIIRNGESNQTSPLKEIIYSIKSDLSSKVDILEVTTFCHQHEGQNKVSTREVRIRSQNDE